MFGRDVTILGIHKLKIGANVYLAKGVWINALGEVTLEDEIKVGPYSVITSTKLGFNNGSVFQGGTHFAPVLIKKGTWVAAHATIVAGVTVGQGCIIAANSVVVKRTSPNTILSGVPAVQIAQRKDNPGLLGAKIG